MVEKVGEAKSAYRFATCKNCASILRYVKREIISYIKRDYTGDADEYKYIICPECNDKVYVK